MFNPTCFKHLGLENRKKGLQLCFQLSVNVLYVDGISVTLHYFAKIIFTTALQLCKLLLLSHSVLLAILTN